MNRILLILATVSVASVALFFANQAKSCDGIAFTQGACYSAPFVQKQVAYNYVEPLVLPLNQYVAYQPSQLLVLPQKVTVTRPETVLQLEQVHGYDNAAPFVLKQHGYAVQQFNGHHVQQFNNHHAQQFVVKQRQLNNHHVQQFNQRGNGGLLGRIQDNIQARKADRQDFRQQQALKRENFRQLQLSIRSH